MWREYCFWHVMCCYNVGKDHGKYCYLHPHSHSDMTMKNLDYPYHGPGIMVQSWTGTVLMYSIILEYIPVIFIFTRMCSDH